jgi:hypothetical protein
MTNFYTPHTADKTKALIIEKFEVSSEYAECLALAALNGIESHGGNPEDWETVKETVRLVVEAWINNGAFRINAV